MFFNALQAIVNGFKLPMTIYGFTFSFWDLYWWGLFAGLLIWIIVKILD